MQPGILKKRCTEADVFESRDKARVNTLASSGDDDEGGLSSFVEAVMGKYCCRKGQGTAVI